MSLVGSLEDLGLGDILQIVSLSRKSGILKLNSRSGEGRIVLRDGKVWAATVKGEPEDLRSILIGGGFIDDAEFDAAVNRSRRTGMAREAALCESTAITSEQIEVLRREHVERAVIAMFSWIYGEFSFEVGGEIDDREAELLLGKGMNAEFFAIEATRLGDERLNENPDLAADASTEGESGADPGGEEYDGGEVTFSGEFDALDFSDAHEAIGLTVAQRIEPEMEVASEANALEAELAGFDQVAPLQAAVADATLPKAPSSVRLIAIDPSLDALEWLKSELASLFSRIHIFQKTEDGVARVKQYLGKGETPIVLIAASMPSGGVSGSAGVEALAERLRALAPRMPILVTAEDTGAAPQTLTGNFANGVVARPLSSQLTDHSRWPNLHGAGKKLSAVLAQWIEVLGGGESSRTVSLLAPLNTARDSDLSELVEVSAKLHNPAGNDVMSLVLDFAKGVFSRVVIFIVRDEVVVGLGQRGLEESGGPGDEELAELRIPVADVDWFRHVLVERRSIRATVSEAESCPLSAVLGPPQPAEVFVAPIESGGGIAALLYGDTVIEDSPMGDTSTIEVVLHQAGLALDRALLERALADS